MRFRHLPIGQRFTFQGVSYTKTSPLLGSATQGDGQRMIPQSADVSVSDGADIRAPAFPSQISSETLGPALEQLQRDCHSALSCDSPQQAREALDAAFERLRELLTANDHS